MLIEAGKTGKIVNIKKAQFLNAEKMQFAVDKVKSTGNDQVWLTERGTLFGPSELVVDFRNIQKLAALTDHVVMDCTHSAQETQSNEGTTGGNRAYVPFFAKTAKLWGANAFFIETHPNPDQGLSDGPNMLKLSDLEALITDLL
jgi:2-dehydro-3-deoxyphosphooctonate aldolase (KDO 8-P synthase)